MAFARGVPLTFLAQLLVAPSRDLFPEAKGDVLCFFLDGDWADESSVEAHWVDADGAPLLDHCPIESPFRPCWGQRHRTEDHPEANRRSDARRIAIVEGTKLGGAPARIQPDYEIPREIYRGALGSVSSHEAWPFSDAERMTHDEVFAAPTWGWTFGDMGSIALLWNGGRLELDFGCY